MTMGSDAQDQLVTPERVMLDELRRLVSQIDSSKSLTQTLMARRTDIWGELRSLGVTYERIAEASGVAYPQVVKKLKTVG